MKRNKSIKVRLVSTSVAFILSVSLLIAFTSIVVARNALRNTVEVTLGGIANQATIAIQNAIDIQLKALEVIAGNEKIIDTNVSIKEKIKVLKSENERAGYSGMSFVDANGNLYSTNEENFDVSNDTEFKRAMEGIPNVSEPIVSKIDNSMIVLYAVPVKNNGSIVGVVMAAKDGKEISDYSNSIKFGETGQAFMINKEGTTIAHNNMELVLNRDNDFENVKNDPSLESLVEIEKKMVTGEKGAGEYQYKGHKKYAGYGPVGNTGWSLAITIDAKEILSELNPLIWSTFIIVAVIVSIGIIVISILAKRIVEPIKKSMTHLDEISNGDLRGKISEEILHREDEFGKMAESLSVMRDSLSNIVKEIKENAHNVKGQSGNIALVAEELCSSSQTIAMAIDEVAKGAGAQAEDLVEITSILQEFSMGLEEIVERVRNVNGNTNNIKNMAYSSNKDMNKVVESVESVNKVFLELTDKTQHVGENIGKINEITSLINAISEQTNLLALNAAIEAARAGEAGRGFSVVADEIRKLADESKNSVNKISDLISIILKDTEVMVNTTDSVKGQINSQQNDIYTAITSFEKITEAVDDIIPKINDVSDSIEILQHKKVVILEKVEGASAISEEVAASSEEIAASTEEMNKATEEIAASIEALRDTSKSMSENIDLFKM